MNQDNFDVNLDTKHSFKFHKGHVWYWATCLDNCRLGWYQIWYNTFGDTQAFGVAPSSAENGANTWFYDQRPNECPINLICTFFFVPTGKWSCSSQCQGVGIS